MRHGNRARQAGIGDRPGDDPRARVIGDVGRAAALGLHRRHLLGAAQRHLERFGRGLRQTCPSEAGQAGKDHCNPSRHCSTHDCLLPSQGPLKVLIIAPPALRSRGAASRRGPTGACRLGQPAPQRRPDGRAAPQILTQMRPMQPPGSSASPAPAPTLACVSTRGDHVCFSRSASYLVHGRGGDEDCSLTPAHKSALYRLLQCTLYFRNGSSSTFRARAGHFRYSLNSGHIVASH